jgi:hypothetical protein
LGVRALTALALALALLLPAGGCTGLYHRTRAQLAPDPTTAASLRRNETAQAEKAVQQAAAKLRESLQHGQSAAVIQSDFDRLEATAFDLERRTLEAADAEKRSGNPGPPSGETERLIAEARSWLEYVRLNRSLDTAQQSQNLGALINHSAGS